LRKDISQVQVQVFLLFCSSTNTSQILSETLNNSHKKKQNLNDENLSGTNFFFTAKSTNKKHKIIFQASHYYLVYVFSLYLLFLIYFKIT
jgi:hypothetical protein